MTRELFAGPLRILGYLGDQPEPRAGFETSTGGPRSRPFGARDLDRPLGAQPDRSLCAGREWRYSGGRSRFHVPERPPDFSRSWTFSMNAPRSFFLIMS